MVEEEMKERISKDFNHLKGKLLGVVLFGSYANYEYMIRSDIDICLVAHREDTKEIFKMVLESDVTEWYDTMIL